MAGEDARRRARRLLARMEGHGGTEILETMVALEQVMKETASPAAWETYLLIEELVNEVQVVDVERAYNAGFEQGFRLGMKWASRRRPRRAGPLSRLVRWFHGRAGTAR